MEDRSLWKIQLLGELLFTYNVNQMKITPFQAKCKIFTDE